MYSWSQIAWARFRLHKKNPVKRKCNPSRDWRPALLFFEKGDFGSLSARVIEIGSRGRGCGVITEAAVEVAERGRRLNGGQVRVRNSMEDEAWVGFLLHAALSHHKLGWPAGGRVRGYFKCSTMLSSQSNASYLESLQLAQTEITSTKCKFTCANCSRSTLKWKRGYWKRIWSTQRVF